MIDQTKQNALSGKTAPPARTGETKDIKGEWTGDENRDLRSGVALPQRRAISYERVPESSPEHRKSKLKWKNDILI